MKDIKIITSSILIIVSFFIGYFFALEKNKSKKINRTKNYVNLEILKTKIKIFKDKNTQITINGNIVNSNEYKLK